MRGHIDITITPSFSEGSSFETGLLNAFGSNRYFDPNAVDDRDALDGLFETVDSVDFTEFLLSNIPNEEEE